MAIALKRIYTIKSDWTGWLCSWYPPCNVAVAMYLELLDVWLLPLEADSLILLLHGKDSGSITLRKKS